MSKNKNEIIESKPELSMANIGSFGITNTEGIGNELILPCSQQSGTFTVVEGEHENELRGYFAVVIRQKVKHLKDFEDEGANFWKCLPDISPNEYINYTNDTNADELKITGHIDYNDENDKETYKEHETNRLFVSAVAVFVSEQYGKIQLNLPSQFYEKLIKTIKIKKVVDITQLDVTLYFEKATGKKSGALYNKLSMKDVEVTETKPTDISITDHAMKIGEAFLQDLQVARNLADNDYVDVEADENE